jgi:hypothetical protein
VATISGMSWGDVAIAAGPSVVAVVAIGAGFREQRRALAHERVLADVADARRVFDDAAVDLHRASVARSGVESALTNHAETHWTKAPDAYPNARAASEALRAMVGRLGVRLPAGDPALVAYDTARIATLNAANAMGARTAEPGANVGKAFEIVQAEHQRLLDATADFLSAANEIVGTARAVIAPPGS